MKRRHFILSTLAAFLPLNAVSAPKKETTGSVSNKSTVKTNSKTKPSTKNNKNAKPTAQPKPAVKTPTPKKPAPLPTPLKTPASETPKTQSFVATPENSIIDRKIKGTTTDQLPPLKAPNPPTSWRHFEVAYSFELPEDSGAVTVFCPLPSPAQTLYQQPKRILWTGQVQAEIENLYEKEVQFLKLSAAPQGFFKRSPRGKARVQTTTSLAPRKLDVAKRSFAPEMDFILRENLKESAFLPTRGKIRNLVLKIVGRIQDPLAQVKSLYDWVVHNARFAQSQNGNVTLQIESGIFGGDSVDLSALFVALCRTIGVPARNVYGIRVGQSKIIPELPLGVAARSEFYIPGYGWIGVDLGSVSEGRAFSHKKDLHKIFFGLWENNWVAFHWGENILQHHPRFIEPVALINQQTLPRFAFQKTYREI